MPVAGSAVAEGGMLAKVIADPERLYLVVTETFFHPAIGGLLLTAVLITAAITAIATDGLPFIRTRLPRRDARQGLAGTTSAVGGRSHRGRHSHSAPGIGDEPGGLCLEWHGRGVRAGDASGPVLAAVQLLGRTDLDNHRNGSGLNLVGLVGRSGGSMGHSAGHSRLPDGHSGGRRRYTPHTQTIV